MRSLLAGTILVTLAALAPASGDQTQRMWYRGSFDGWAGFSVCG